MTPIPGFSRYVIDKDGLVYFAKYRRKLTPRLIGRHLCVSLTSDLGKTTVRRVSFLQEAARGLQPYLPDDAVVLSDYPGYFVDPRGEIYSTKRTGSLVEVVTLKKPLDGHGYARVNLVQEDGTQRTVRVHCLVLTQFKGPCPEGCEGRHLNGDRENNSITNLEWGTKLENASDKHAHGTTVRGVDFWSAKLTDADVIEIRRLNSDEGVSYAALAERYGVWRSTIRNICLRKTWKHVP